MRALTAKQKKIIERVLRDHEPSEFERSALGKMNPIRGAEDLPDHVMGELAEINDTEILFQEVDHFIDDWRWKQIDQRKYYALSI